MADLVDIATINLLCNTDITADHPTAYVNGIIEVVSDHVRAYCLGTLFVPTTITDERGSSYVSGRTNKLTVKLKHAPLISVDSLKYKIGADETTLPITDLDIDEVNSYIYLLWYGPLWKRAVPWTTVTTYMAGHTTIPDAVKMATALLVREWVSADDAISSGTERIMAGFRIGNYAENYSTAIAEVGNLGMGTTMSIRARGLLGKYRRVGVK